MSPFEITGWILVIVILTMLVAYFVPRRKREAPRMITPEGRLTFPTLKRPVGKHPALGAPYHSQFGKRVVPPTKKPVVVLSPRQIESVNIKRKLRGYPPLNRAGVKNAISASWDTPYRQPATTSDWLLYLILWETFSDDHKAPTCAGTGGFTIDPNLPYNGHGGEFAGAGASGSWDKADIPPDVSSAAALISTGSHFAEPTPDAPNSLRSYSPGDTVGGYSNNTDSAPSYSTQPDPSTVREPDPSPVSDSSSSYSSSSSDSSSSSSSSDSGSSGGDSGGGGGGGGD